VTCSTPCKPPRTEPSASPPGSWSPWPATAPAWSPASASLSAAAPTPKSPRSPSGHLPAPSTFSLTKISELMRSDGTTCAVSAHPRRFPAMPKAPDHRDNHPSRPVRAPYHHDAGRRLRDRLLRVEDAHARNEGIEISSPVRMVRPDELSAATLGFLHSVLTSIPATTWYSPRLRAVIAQARSCPEVTVAPIARTDFLTAAHRTSSGRAGQNFDDACFSYPSCLRLRMVRAARAAVRRPCPQRQRAAY
jgi:hypothetical protein